MKLSEVLWGPEVWGKNSYRPTESKMCLVAAMSVVERVRDGHISFSAERRMLRAIGIPIGIQGGVSIWNDAPARTWDEVAAVISEYDRLTMLEEP